MQLRNVVLVDGARSAFARGARASSSPRASTTPARQVVRALLDRNPKVKDSMIEDIGLGNVARRGEFTCLGDGRAPRRPAARGLRVQHATASAARAWRRCTASRMSIDGRRDRLRHRARHRAHGPRARRRRHAAPQTRITKLNPRLFELNDVQRNMAPDHDENFSVPFPDYILELAAAHGDDADRAERGRGLRPDARRARRSSRPRATARPRAAYEAGIYKDEIIPLEVEEPVFDDEGQLARERDAARW